MADPKPAAPAGKPKKKSSFFNLRVKFGAATFLLISAIMATVGFALFDQQRRTLTREVLERGRTIAEGAAAGAGQAFSNQDPLTLAVLVDKSVQPEEALKSSVGYGFDNLGHLADGLKRAFEELPGVLIKALAQAGLKLPLAVDEPVRSRFENEGVYEALVVDKQGKVVAFRSQGKRVGDKEEMATEQPYRPPVYVEAASEQAPYPIYELEFMDAGGKRQVRRLFDVERKIVEEIEGNKVEIGAIHLGLDEGLIRRVIFDATMKLAAVALAAILGGILFAYFLVSFMVRPVGRLLKGVLAIANGDFGTRIRATSKDELGELTNAFNTMAKSLSENELLKGAFTRYVSDAALKQILSDPAKTGLHSRRALATIYSSDVRGFTAMSETLEPEQVVQVINTYLSLQTEIIVKHEGVVDRFIGDATIGVFGKEVERDDDALRAVKAALEAQAAIARLNAEREKRGEVVKLVGIGVNTGVVVTGNMGSTQKMEYTTAGENAMLADRICDVCPGGLVWISESTYELVSDFVVAEAKEPLKLEGRGEPLPVYEVKGLKGA